MLSHEFALTITNPEATIKSTITVSESTETEVSNQVDASSSLDEDISVLFADIVSFFVISDQDVTLKINTTDQTINLLANKPYWWHNQLPGAPANPITHNITKLTFDNTANLVVANVKAAFLVTS